MDINTIINRANQLNPNNWRYWMSRGYSCRPENWQAIFGNIVQDGNSLLSIMSCGNAAVKSVLLPCIHGIKKVLCFFCSLTGVVILLTVGTASAVYYYRPEAVKKYALMGWNTTGSICRSVGENSIIVARYSAKLTKEYGPHVWHYGVMVPYSVTKTGLYYSGVGVKRMATTIGYYSGISQKVPEKPRASWINHLKFANNNFY